MFRYVPPEELPGVWEFVFKGLEDIRRITKPPWSVDNVRSYLLDGNAALWTREDGFVILEKSREPFTLLPYMNVWAEWFEAQHAQRRREEMLAWLDTQERLNRCAFTQFSSPRLGWERINSGFTKHHSVYRRNA